MDLSDIIFYIVFAIIGIFSTAVQNKGKKKSEKKPQPRHENTPRSESNAPSPHMEYTIEMPKEEERYEELSEETTHTTAEYTLEEIFRALREGTPLTPQERTEPAQAEHVVVSNFPEEREFIPTQPTTPTYIEGERAIVGISGDEISDSNIYDGNETTHRFDTDEIDWRQAVITSEILTRKY